MQEPHAPRVARRSVVKGVSWAAPALALTAVAPAYATSAICEVAWTETMLLEFDGKNPSQRDKEVTDCGDVAIDAWTSTTTIDGTVHRRPTFRVIVGTVIAVSDVEVNVVAAPETVVQFEPPGPVSSPATAATPCAYRVYSIDTAGQPQVDPSGREISWAIGDMPAGSSVMFTVQGQWRPVTDTSPYQLRITVRGIKDCEESWDGPCPDERVGCPPSTPWTGA